MKKVRRITRNEEFQEIIHSAKKISGNSFLIYYRKAVHTYNRIGISVSKKSGNAVVRNKIKRQVRMMINELQALTLDQDLLIIVKKVYNPSSYTDNRKCLETVLKTVRIKTVNDHKGVEL